MIIIKMHRPDSDFSSLNCIAKYFEMLAFLKDEVVPKCLPVRGWLNQLKMVT